MSRTLIREGLTILKEISQRGTSPSYIDRSRDTPVSLTLGVPTRYVQDGNYVEFSRSNYVKPYGKLANRDRQIMLDAGGLETSTGTILYQDPHQLTRSMDKLRNTLSTKPKPKRAK